MPRLASLLCTALLAAAPALATAAETIRWPLPWQDGQVWEYDTELVDREVTDGEALASRTTDRTTLRVRAGADGGFVQTWDSAESRLEAVEGERALLDALAARLPALDALEIQGRLDRNGRYLGLANRAELTLGLRRALMGETLPAPTDMAQASVEQVLSAAMDGYLTEDATESIAAAELRVFNAFAGGAWTAGRRYRDNAPMYSPLYGRPVPGLREYWVEADPQDPALAQLRWTHRIDPRGDTEALWSLVTDLALIDLEDVDTRKRPKNLDYREEGRMLFRRADGAILLYERSSRSRYGEQQAGESRQRMRLIDSPRGWDD
jgi:hypothetical protein